MSIVEVLTREHRVFERLIGRIERSLKLDEVHAREELRESILVLLVALERHEDIENLVFRQTSAADKRGARALFHEIAVQHRKIGALKDELLQAFDEAQADSYDSIKSLALQLVGKLRSHFQTEENRLWPRYLGLSSRSLERSVSQRAKQSVIKLERDITENTSAVSQYMGGAR